MVKLLKGYLEDITESWLLEDMEEGARMFDECWRSYGGYLSENLRRFPSDIKEFVEAHVLGGSSPKRLHDDLVSRASFSFRTQNNELRDANLEILQRSREPEALLSLCYSEVSHWDFPVGEPHLLIDRHEVFHVEDGFQHNIYFVGCAPARIAFKRMSFSQSDEGARP